MAVVPRKRKRGPTVFYVVNNWRGKPVSEKVGPVKRDAQARDRQMKKEIADGTYEPPATRIKDRLGDFGTVFLGKRTNAYAVDERRLFRLHIESRPWLRDLALDAIEPVDHIDRLITELREEKKEDGSRRLTDKSISNLMGVLSLIFNAAIRAKRCARSPIVLEPRALKRAPAKEKEIYSPGEVRLLTESAAISWPVRVLNALAFFGGMREGEVCGRRWGHLYMDADPLWALIVRDQYDGVPLKTDRPRVVPVHPLLRAILTAWGSEGFELYTGHPPTADDFIVPNISSRANKANHTRSSYYKLFVRFAQAAGVRPRSLHSTRHTFISLCRRGGAPKDMVERITHNARGDIVDQYTHIDWKPLCDAVLCLRIDTQPTLPRPPGSGGNSGGSTGDQHARERGNVPLFPKLERGSIPGASTTKRHKTSHPVGSRQETRQEFSGGLGQLEERSSEEQDFAAALAEDGARAQAAQILLGPLMWPPPRGPR